MKHMKTYGMIILMLIFINQLRLNAQDKSFVPVKSKHEFNISIDNIFARSPQVYIQTYYPYITSYHVVGIDDIILPEVGLGYKHHFNKFAIRTKFNVGSKSQEFEEKVNNSNNDDKSEFDLFESTLWAGIQLNNDYKRSRVFYGIDGFYNYKKLKIKDLNNYADEMDKKETTLNGYGFAPIIGAGYFISEKISISTEVKFITKFYKKKHKTITHLDYEEPGPGNETIERTTTDKGHSMKVGPLGNLSINIHL